MLRLQVGIGLCIFFLYVQTTSMKIDNLKSACFSPFFVAFFKSWIRAMNVHIIILRDPLGIGRE